ncbi:hypothetical protein [Bradyrhizobium sp. UNPA324]|uniref:hypothetical protein n=1 Tax=Bradyrhizobium sp. UNPA324 TaxID=1141174 RepID=UPI00114E5726|nr:hypothetical protein [Bradyrhizobium sp. UNPA324]
MPTLAPLLSQLEDLAQRSRKSATSVGYLEVHRAEGMVRRQVPSMVIILAENGLSKGWSPWLRLFEAK